MTGLRADDEMGNTPTDAPAVNSDTMISVRVSKESIANDDVRGTTRSITIEAAPAQVPLPPAQQVQEGEQQSPTHQQQSPSPPNAAGEKERPQSIRYTSGAALSLGHKQPSAEAQPQRQLISGARALELKTMHKELASVPNNRPEVDKRDVEEKKEHDAEAEGLTCTTTSTLTGSKPDSPLRPSAATPAAATATAGASATANFPSTNSAPREEDLRRSTACMTIGDPAAEARVTEEGDAPTNKGESPGHLQTRDQEQEEPNRQTMMMLLPLLTTALAANRASANAGATTAVSPAVPAVVSSSDATQSKATKKRPRSDGDPSTAAGGKSKRRSSGPGGGTPFTTGRWTEAEHQAFLAGLATYGREWKRVALHIPTRTSAQVRSHAQKYFCKLQQQQEQQQHELQQRQHAAAAAAAATSGSAAQGSSSGTSSGGHPQHLQSSTLRANVERILAEPETVQAEVDDTLQRLRERYRQLQERLRRSSSSNGGGGGGGPDPYRPHGGGSSNNNSRSSSPSSLEHSELIALHVLHGGLPRSANNSHSSGGSGSASARVAVPPGPPAGAGGENGDDGSGSRGCEEGSRGSSSRQQHELREDENSRKRSREEE